MSLKLLDLTKLPSGSAMKINPIDWMGTIEIDVTLIMHENERPAELVKQLRLIADSIEQQIDREVQNESTTTT